MSETKRRGRPVITLDNRRVRAILRGFNTVFELVEAIPCMDDVLTGTVHLRTEGQGSTRPLSKRLLFSALTECDTIKTENVAIALGRDHSRASVARYTALARVASKAIYRQLALNPTWEAEAATLRSSRAELDAPYRSELAALGLA